MNEEATEIATNFLHAAFLDAAVERKLTQIKMTIVPESTGRETTIRVIIVPETMDSEWPAGLGAKQ